MTHTHHHLQRARQHICRALCGFFAAILICACSGQAEKEPNALVSVGGISLTRSQLDRVMPSSLSPEDSAAFARAYIRQWAFNQLIANQISGELDLTDINRKVEDYRNELIMQEYTQRMYEEKGMQKIPEDSLCAFFDANQKLYTLKRPMVKGVYLKVASDSKALPQLRRLYKSKKDDDIDKLDKALLNGAVHYDYFRDKWIDWDQIESRVPYDFGASDDAYLKPLPSLDFTADGYTYLLDISDVILSGEPMPFETARPLIEERLSMEQRNQYREHLKRDIYDKAVEEGTIKLY